MGLAQRAFADLDRTALQAADVGGLRREVAEGGTRPVGGRGVGALHSVHDGRDQARHMEGVLAEELADPAEPRVPGQFGGQCVQYVHADAAGLGGDAGVDVPDETGVPGGADARAFREDRRAGGAEPVGALADLEEGDAVGGAGRDVLKAVGELGLLAGRTGVVDRDHAADRLVHEPEEAAARAELGLPGPCDEPLPVRVAGDGGCRRYESRGQDLREVQLRDLLGEGHAGEQGFDPGVPVGGFVLRRPCP